MRRLKARLKAASESYPRRVASSPGGDVLFLQPEQGGLHLEPRHVVHGGLAHQPREARRQRRSRHPHRPGQGGDFFLVPDLTIRIRGPVALSVGASVPLAGALAGAPALSLRAGGAL